MSLQIGHSLKGYDILDRIGSGGFGAVYRAYQSTLGREVAVKVIMPGFANQPEFIRRFEAEAQIIARLEHLHIVPLYDYWRDPDGAYLVMRWLRGGSLKDVLAEGPLSPAAAAKLLDQVASGLAAAHAAQVVHRDIKPSNILLDEEGNAYLADFSIAKDLARQGAPHTNSEAIVGSPDYLSPEQARSEPVTPQTDIYGLGVTLYEMLTGHLPFPNLTGVERLFKHISEPLPRIENLEPGHEAGINEVVQKATAKNPRLRYQDALQLAAAFRAAAQLGDENESALVESLTLREQEVLNLITQGHTNREIAERLYVEVSTVKWYVRQIYRKLDVRNRRQAIARARTLDLMVADDGSEEAAPRDVSVTIARPAPQNPYKGLRPFTVADAPDFFGRRDLVQKLLAALSVSDSAGPDAAGGARRSNAVPGSPANHRFLAVVGPSGSGKSSLIHAGLLPALIQGEIPGSERWFIVDMTPGSNPLDELEVALLRIAANQGGNLRQQLERDSSGLLRAAGIILPRDGSDLLLVVDQFEELFTLTADEELRLHFLELLTSAVTAPLSRVRIVISLRADYYDRPLHYPTFGDLVRTHMETVLPLSTGELEQAIVRPAEQAGVSFEPGLAATIIDDVLYQPGALPLLQYSLTELFENREGQLLTLQGYREIGGVTGALAKRAEELYLEHDAVGQEGIRQMFLRLVAVNGAQDALPDTRRRVLQSEILSAGPDEDLMDDIIYNFTAYRLLTLDHDPASRRPTLEVAHEALLREWDRLRHWLEDSRDDLHQHRRLQMLAAEWLQNDRDPGLLLRQTRLDQFAAWSAATGIALTGEEQAFLADSLLQRQDRRAGEEARRQRELETARKLAETERQRAAAEAEAAQRLRRRAIYLASALVIAAILAGLALFASRQSGLNAQEAQINANIAGTQEALAAREALSAATAEVVAVQQRQIAEEERDAAQDAAALAAGAQATAEAEAQQRAEAESVAVQQREAAEAQARLAVARELSLASINNLSIDPELSVLLAIQAVQATAAIDGFALPEAESALHNALVNLRVDRQFPGSTPGSCDWCGDVTYSGDGTLLAASGAENTAGVWAAATGERLLSVDAHAEPVVAVDLSPDNSLLVTASEDDTAMIWTIPTGPLPAALAEPDLILTGHAADLTDVAFSPSGAQIATASRDNSVKLWESATGQEIVTLSGHEGSVRDILFTADGAQLITGSSDGTIKVWDIAFAQEQQTLSGHTDRVSDLALHEESATLASASWDGTAKLWNLTTGAELLSVPGDTARAYAVALSPDGTTLAAAGTDAVINLWDAVTGEELLQLPGHQGIVFNLAFSPLGTHLASGAGDGTFRTWDISRAGNHEWMTLDGHRWVMFGVDYSPDGRLLATASWDGTVKTWDAQTGEILRTLLEDEARKMSVQFSPDGRTLAATGDGDLIILWDTSSWRELSRFQGHNGTVLDAAFSPDGRFLATVAEQSDEPGLINIWDTQEEELSRSWVGHDNSIERIAISPDGRFLATASTDGTAKLWNLATADLLDSTSSHAPAVNAVNFSHDGQFLATAGADNAARIWQLDGDKLREHAELQGHSSVVWDAVFSSDDALLATISFDGTVKLWDVATGAEKQTLPGTDNNGREVAFSPDGKFIAVTSGSGLVPIYVLPLEDVLDLARSRLKRTLTPEECRQYLHLDRCPD